MVGTAHDLNRERHWTCARRMSDRRHQLGLTQTDVVDRLAGLGVVATNRTLSAMEHGQGVDVGRLPELAVVLDCTVTYLLGLTEEPERWVPDDSADTAVQDLGVGSGGASAIRPASWILGPDVPERRTADVEFRRA